MSTRVRLELFSTLTRTPNTTSADSLTGSKEPKQAIDRTRHRLRGEEAAGHSGYRTEVFDIVAEMEEWEMAQASAALRDDES